MIDFILENIKFVFYAFLFVIYLVAQARKISKKAAENAPQQSKPVAAKPATPVSRKTFDYKGKREPMKALKQRPMAQAEERRVVYKPVADEELMAESQLIEKTLTERKKEEQTLTKDRVGLKEEHLDPYVDRRKATSGTANWLKDKANLRMAFIASEIFQRKY